MTAGWDLRGGHRGGRDGPLVKGCSVDTAGTRFGYHRDAPWVSQGCPVCTTKPLQAPSHQGAAAEGVEGRNESQDSDFEQSNTARGRARGQGASRAIFTQRKLQLICKGSGSALGNPAGRPRTQGRTVHYFLI